MSDSIVSRKIVYVGGLTSDQYLPGAVRTHTAGIIRALDEREDVELVGVFASYGLPEHEPGEVREFASSPPRTAAEKIRTALRYSRFVNRVIERERPHLVYCRFDPTLTPLIRPAGAGLITEYNDVFLDQIDYALRKGHWGPVGSAIRASRTYRKAIESIERRVFRDSRIVVCVTEGIARHCVRACPSAKTLVLLNASNATLASDGSSHDRGGAESLRISHVGTLTYWDGLEQLLDALALARRRCASFRFLLRIVGTGSLSRELRRRVESLGLGADVEFHPPVPHSAALKILEETDVVPLLKTISSYGLSPIKFYEALAMGCVVLASDIPHINEAPEFAVRVVSYPLVLEEVADALLELHRRRERLGPLREEIRKYARENHTWSARIETLFEALDERAAVDASRRAVEHSK